MNVYYQNGNGLRLGSRFFPIDGSDYNRIMMDVAKGLAIIEDESIPKPSNQELRQMEYSRTCDPLLIAIKGYDLWIEKFPNDEDAISKRDKLFKTWIAHRNEIKNKYP